MRIQTDAAVETERSEGINKVALPFFWVSFFSFPPHLYTHKMRDVMRRLEPVMRADTAQTTLCLSVFVVGRNGPYMQHQERLRVWEVGRFAN